MRQGICEFFEYESAREFVEAISPRGPLFWPQPNPSPWVFRGHSDEKWKLLPSALRPNDQVKLHDIARTPNELRNQSNTNIAQYLAEAILLSDLETELNRIGYPLPVSDPPLKKILSDLWRYWEKKHDGGGTYWPYYSCVQIMSLAQHYGLPTRLLDWSFSPYIGAYFAADPEKLDQENCDGYSTVWALNTTGMIDGITMRGAPNLRAIPVPRSTNPNFHAQNGIFTMFGPDGENVGLFESLANHSLEEALENFNESKHLSPNHLFLRRFRFPRKIAGEILWLLEKEGLTAATIFPGHSGAARAVLEKRFSIPAK